MADPDQADEKVMVAAYLNVIINARHGPKEGNGLVGRGPFRPLHLMVGQA